MVEKKLVNSEGCIHYVTTEEQLEAFLAAGWTEVEEPVEEPVPENTEEPVEEPVPENTEEPVEEPKEPAKNKRNTIKKA